MPVYHEGKVIGDIVHWEEDQRYSREVVTLAANQSVETGSILARHNQTGKYHLFDPQSKDGIDQSAAISITKTNAQTDTEILVIKREAVLKAHGLIWTEKITDKQKQTAIDQLQSIGLLIRD